TRRAWPTGHAAPAGRRLLHVALFQLVLHPAQQLGEPVLLDDAPELAAVIADEARALRHDVHDLPFAAGLAHDVVDTHGLLAGVLAIASHRPNDLPGRPLLAAPILDLVVADALEALPVGGTNELGQNILELGALG